MPPNSHELTINILLADDDLDDCLLFKEALEELPFPTHLTTVNNGQQLMQLLDKTSDSLPDILYMDLNMPRKNGFTCLLEIKQSENLKKLPVIILSTSLDHDTIRILFKNGAQHFIRKPNDYMHLKNLIQQSITLVTQISIELPDDKKYEIIQEPNSNEA